jgi:tRNA(Ile)-lysidine synthase
LTGPHPAVAAARLAVRRGLADVDPGRTVVVACSGGADSLALLAATAFEARVAGWRVLGVSVDHGLQPGSAEVAAAVVAQMAALGAEETLTARVVVEGGGAGPEAAARQARYAVLEEVAQRSGAAAVLLGHTLDDQAETVLLGLARGSGGRSIAGMRRAYDVFRRPLLDLTREQTREACRAQDVEWWDDPHNEDPRFTRVRVRTRVLPVLEAELGPGVARTLARTADQLRDDMELLDRLADEALARAVVAEVPGGLSVQALGREPTALRRRALRLSALAAGSPAEELAHLHVLALDELVTAWRGQQWVDLPGHLRGRRRDGVLLLERAAAAGPRATP